jgi:regulator of sirC expression with transglutaminase-like and TPR domain
MAESHTPADNIVYDLVAIQYHSLKAGQVYEQYSADAEDHEDVKEFIEQCRQEDAERAVRAHDLLGKLTAKGAGIG